MSPAAPCAPNLDAAVADLTARIASLDGARVFVAIVGPPASGKSTLAAALVEAVPGAALVPMDGFHLDDRVLRARGLLARKGAPETFDAAGLARALDALRRGEAVVLPVFDRAREIAVAGAHVVPPEARVVVVEGNWLLLDGSRGRDSGFAALGPSALGPSALDPSGLDLWDLTVRLDAPDAVLRARLEARWAHLPAAVAAAKIDGNDLPNARLVREGSRPADVVLAG